MPKEGEEPLVTAIEEVYVGYVARYNLIRMANDGLEFRSSSPRELKRGPSPEHLPMRTFLESKRYWTTPRGPSFPAERQTRQRDTLLLRSFVELRPVIRS